MIFSDDDLLPLSLLQHLLFCERRAALIQIEGIWEDNLFTAEGSILHNKVDDDLLIESRGDVRISRGLLLRSLQFGLTGKADVVEFRSVSEVAGTLDGNSAKIGISLPCVRGLWQPFPVEYKRGRLRHEKGYEIQLCAQAMCLEEMLHCTVPEGALFYGKTRRRKEVRFDDKLREETANAATRLHELVKDAKTPVARYEKKCESCSLLELCMPKVTGATKSVSKYLERIFAE